MQLHRAFHCGLGVEFGRKTDLEQDVFHDITAEWALELERLAFEGHIVETPGFSGQCRRIPDDFLMHRIERMGHGAAARVARSPALAWAGVRGMPISAQHAVVDPTVRNGGDDRVFVATQHRGRHGRGCEADQDHVVQTDAVERILQRVHALNFMRLDRPGQGVAHGQALAAVALGLAAEVVADGQNRAEIVGGMAPFRSQPGVVEVKPAHQRADIEGGLDRVQLERRARDARAAGQFRARHQRTEVLHATLELHRQHRAGQRIQQHVAGGVVGLLRLDLGVDHVVGDVDHRLIGIGANGGADIGMTHRCGTHWAAH